MSRVQGLGGPATHHRRDSQGCWDPSWLPAMPSWPCLLAERLPSLALASCLSLGKDSDFVGSHKTSCLSASPLRFEACKFGLRGPVFTVALAALV